MAHPPALRRACLSSLILLVVLLTACQPGMPGNPPRPTGSAQVTVQAPLAQTTTSGVPAATLAPTTTPQPPTSTPLIPTPTLEPPTPTPTLPPPADPRTAYTLTVQLNYSYHSLAVKQQIAYTNTTGETLDSLVLDVEPNRQPGVFTLDAVTWADGTPAEGVTLEGPRLAIPLAQALAPGEAAQWEIAYSLNLPPIPPPSDEFRPVPFGYSERQTNLVDWYPFLPDYRPGEGWIIHDDWWFGEHLALPSADFKVDLQVEDPLPELTLAASAPADQEGSTYHYRLEACRSFAVSLSTMYVVETAIAGEVTLTGYAFPWDAAAGKQALHDAAEAVNTYSRLFGPYPHTSLAVVEADFLDGMEYDGLFFLSWGFYNLYDGTPQGYLTAITAHETAHEWWFALVGNDQAEEPWLDEGLATYSEKLFYEAVYPDALPWWWGVRVNYYEPAGTVNHPIYDFQGFRLYRDAIYLRGAIFMDALRQEIGDEAFFAFIRDYAQSYTQRLATASDFFTVLSRHTQADLSGLKAQFFTPGTE